jgi:hypothetical protein
MNNELKELLHMVGITFTDIYELDGLTIPRETFISSSKYNEIQQLIPKLKKQFSSSCMTCLQETAGISQKWPLLNLVRQILSVYRYKMIPIRKSDGYTSEGVKKYKRFFSIEKEKEQIVKTIFEL